MKSIRTIGSDSLSKPLRSDPLSFTHPYLAKEWRGTGPDGPDDVTPGSGKAVNWKHQRCGRKLNAVSINSRTRAFDEGCESEGCIYCSGSYLRVRDSGPQPLSDELLKECIDETGSTSKKLLLDNSSELRLWQCSSGHKFRARVNVRTGTKNYEPQGCPCKHCFHGERVDLSETEFFDLFKRIKGNNGYDPRNLPIDFRVFWGCSKNKKHQSLMTFREFEEKGCQPCRQKKKVFLSNKKYKELASQFVEAVRNPGFSPDNIPIGSSIVCTWQCSKNPEHIWRKAVSRRTIDGEGCPYCSGKRLCASNSLAAHKEIALEWDHERNNTTPDCIKAKDRNEKYWFICSLGHSFALTAFERVVLGYGCKICRVVSDNVAETHPWVVDEWHPDRNSELTPYNTTSGSKKKVWWLCKKDFSHIYEKSVYDRCIRSLGCPFCINRQLTPTNNFESVHPELLRHFDEKKNDIEISQVKDGSKKNFWWLCDCGQSYKRSVYNIISIGSGCISCRQRQLNFLTSDKSKKERAHRSQENGSKALFTASCKEKKQEPSASRASSLVT